MCDFLEAGLADVKGAGLKIGVETDTSTLLWEAGILQLGRLGVHTQLWWGQSSSGSISLNFYPEMFESHTRELHESSEGFNRSIVLCSGICLEAVC